MNWYYEQEGEQKGPISEEELKQLAASGQIGADNLVWREGMGDWASYGSVFAAESTKAPEGSVACPTCGTAVQPDELIPAGDTKVCPNCRDTYAQGIKEGLSQPVATPGSRGTGGQTPNPELRAMARQTLSGQWGPSVGVTFLFVFIQQIMGLVPILGPIAQLICSGPFTLGYNNFFLKLSRDEQPEMGNLFSGFSNFVLGLGVYIITALIVGLSALAAAIPGGIFMFAVVVPNAQGGIENDPQFWVALVLMIIPAMIVSTYMYLRYSMVYFIANDEPENGVLHAIQKSPQLVYGHKMKLFLFGLSYLGWFILGMMAFLIGFLWAMTYFYAGLAAFYDDLGGGEAENSLGTPGLTH